MIGNIPGLGVIGTLRLECFTQILGGSPSHPEGLDGWQVKTALHHEADQPRFSSASTKRVYQGLNLSVPQPQSVLVGPRRCGRE